MASSSSTNPAYDVPSFNSRDRLVCLHLKSPISSTINRMSGTLPPHPYHRTPLLPTRGNEIRLLSSSRKNVPASGCSNDFSMPPTTMPWNSKCSLRIRPSTQTSTGENSPGDRCHNGHNCRCHHKTNDTSATPSASHTNHPIRYNPRADESDYDDNETPDIADLYGDEVYNNID